MSKKASVQDAPENPVYSMLENAMWVVDENEAKKFLGADRLLQLMVDCVDGFGPTSHRYYFVSDLLYWNMMHWSKNRP